MTKYPIWKYIIIIFVLIIGLVYTIPNFYGDVPAVQISGSHSATQIDTNSLATIEAYLTENDLTPVGQIFDGKTLKIKFSNTDIQLKARDVIQKHLGSDYIVALNLISSSCLYIFSFSSRLFCIFWISFKFNLYKFNLV